MHEQQTSCQKSGHRNFHTNTIEIWSSRNVPNRIAKEDVNTAVVKMMRLLLRNEEKRVDDGVRTRDP